MHVNCVATFVLLAYLLVGNIQLAIAYDVVSTVGNIQPDILTLVKNARGTVLPSNLSSEYGFITTGEIVAMLAGSVLGWAMADLTLGNGPFAVIGIAAGAALGSLLYRYNF
ncbi:hypothetical protein TI03_01375 [Achromatium sp. WMS1]|nr:hypothetical protein TI03_01375 [Achromatium sp. WMS1]